MHRILLKITVDEDHDETEILADALAQTLMDHENIIDVELDIECSVEPNILDL